MAEAIEVHRQAEKLLAGKSITPGLRRTIVKIAVIIDFLLQR